LIEWLRDDETLHEPGASARRSDALTRVRLRRTRPLPAGRGGPRLSLPPTEADRTYASLRHRLVPTFPCEVRVSHPCGEGMLSLPLPLGEVGVSRGATAHEEASRCSLPLPLGELG
jgi:hypothetical protein